MAKKMIRPLRSDREHAAALAEIERYFERKPKPRTPAADRFDMLALVIEDYERKRWPIEPPDPIDATVGACRRRASVKRTSDACSGRVSVHPTFCHADVD